MALEGTLRDFSLADILQLIGLQRKSGVLTLKREGDVVTVSFLDGAVVTADSLHRPLENRLGTVLVKSGKLTEARLQEALAQQRKTLQRLGTVLVGRGFITEDDLREALAIQITQIIYRLFRWDDGDYHFSQEDEVDYDRDLMEPIAADRLLMEGARMIDEWPLIEHRIPSFGLVFVPAEAAARALASGGGSVYSADIDFGLLNEDRSPPSGVGRATRLARDEAQVLALVDGRRTVQEIIDSTSLGEFETCRLLCQLMDRKLIAPREPVKPRAAPAPPPRVNLVPAAGWLLVGVAAASALLVLSQAATLLAGWPGGRLGSHPGHPTALLLRALDVETIRLAVSRTRLERIDRALYAGCFARLAATPDLGARLQAGEIHRLLPEPGANAFEALVDPAGAAAAGYGVPLLNARDLVDPWGRTYPARPAEDYQVGWTGAGETPYYEIWGRDPPGGLDDPGDQDDRLRIRRELWEFRREALGAAAP